MRVLDLFSGIGGFSLGLERAGMKTVAFCEIEPFQRAVLAKHWPTVKCYPDVRELSAQHLTADGIAIDVICGGFPCQDISVAGKGAGLAGDRSGLWRDFARLIGELRPRYIIVENVSALLGRGLSDVLADLTSIGYDAEWHAIPASHIGAPHRRDRIWIVAYPGSPERRTRDADRRDDGGPHGAGSYGSQGPGRTTQCGTDVADANGRGWREQGDVGETSRDPIAGQSGYGSQIRISSRPRLEIGPGTLGEWAHAATAGTGWWAIEPDVGRVVDGLAARVDRRKRLIALGNGVVPQIPEMIGRAILAAEAAL